ncbi:MAG: DHH family phosphoesterase [Bacteroidetes bacterium HGW-Bacteroidetes-7]|jgi:phosphoesterase RecJ-like protein|nr:MAG: DHH family phosphoesterase [Bacteroidetes bacterium HGW-Bacteroidetes-7]
MSQYIFIKEAKQFFDRVQNSSRILLISHSNPDGDAIGSVTGLRNYLRFKGINSEIAVPNSYPEYLSFLDENKEIKIFCNNPKESIEFADKADLIIALDFNQLSRVDELEKHVLDSNAFKVLIDHHPMPEVESFNLVISNPEVSSTAELIFWILMTLEAENCGKVIHNCKGVLSADVARSLYVGMMTDTNNFSNSVNSATFLMASILMESGVDKDMLQHLVFGGFSELRMRLLGHMLLNKMVIVGSYGAGYICLSAEEQMKYNFSEGDSEGFVNLPLNIKGINISALFTEREDHIRVSLRSTNDFSVNRLSRLHFNGGGHERAAGGKLYIPFVEVADYFEQSLAVSFDECMKKN